MKTIFTLITSLVITFSLHAQISNIELRINGDISRVSYVASSSQINCGLCPQIINREPNTLPIISELQDSVNQTQYSRSSASFSIGASILIPALKAEIQIGPSMRKLNVDKDQTGRYVNRNLSAFIGINPMQFSEFTGRYYLGTSQSLFLDFSDLGVYAQFSYDGGFEEFVRSTNNVALLARWQPTLWLNDQRQAGISLRAAGRMWLMGNSSAEGPFIGATGLPKKVKPNMDWFFGVSIRIAPFN